MQICKIQASLDFSRALAMRIAKQRALCDCGVSHMHAVDAIEPARLHALIPNEYKNLANNIL